MRDREQIRRVFEVAGTIRGTARELGAGRNTVRRALDPDHEHVTLADRFEPAVRDVLSDYPRLTVRQVGDIIEWPGSRRALSELVRRVRAEILEREHEEQNLNRINAGTLNAGRIATVGRVTAGRVTIGRTTHGDQAQGAVHAA